MQSSREQKELVVSKARTGGSKLPGYSFLYGMPCTIHPPSFTFGFRAPWFALRATLCTQTCTCHNHLFQLRRLDSKSAPPPSFFLINSRGDQDHKGPFVCIYFKMRLCYPGPWMGTSSADVQ